MESHSFYFLPIFMITICITSLRISGRGNGFLARHLKGCYKQRVRVLSRIPQMRIIDLLNNV